MRFRKRLKIAKGISLNLSGSGVSLTFGIKGLSVNTGKKGTYLNTGIPGTGLYSRQKISRGSNQSNIDCSNSISEPINKVVIDVKLNEKGNTTLQVFDISGREIFDETIILKVKGSDGYKSVVEKLLKERSIDQPTKKAEKVKETNKKDVETVQTSYFDKETEEILKSENIVKSKKLKKIVSHKKFKDFQEKYGAIPASDKNDHIIRSRMLQGIYRNQKIENAYCNYVFEDSGFVNFMRNKRLESDAKKESEAIKQRERLTDEKRLLENLLSSQPMAFNIFLPLKWNDFEIGNAVFKELFPFLKIKQLVNIKMEYVPGDGIGKNNRTITTDNSCFDVYIEYKNENDKLGGIGIEVKYTESFSNSDYWKETGYKKDRYIDAIKKYSVQFYEKYTKEYLQPTYNQLFRNQLLAEEVKDKFNMDCILAVVYSEEDSKCIDTVDKFKNLMKIENTCIPISISQIVQSAIKVSEKQPEIKSLYKDIYNRYCNYDLLNKGILLNEEKEITKPFIEDICISDIPSSINWKEIFDFAQTFDIDKHYLPTEIDEKTTYFKIHFRKHKQINSESVTELRAILLNYIKEEKLNRNSLPNREQFSFAGKIISKINNIIYNKLWEDR